MQSIKNIIFDFGNVFIDIDIPRSAAAFSDLLQEEFEDIYLQLKNDMFFHRYEVGAFNEESFIWAFQSASKKELQPHQILEAWCAMLLGIPAHRLELLETLKKQYRVFLFSNTNGSHMNWVYRYLKREHDITDFNERFFERTYYSHLIKTRKPNTDGFNLILHDAGLEPANTLFVDDFIENIEAAQSLGLMGLWHDANKDIRDTLEENNIL